MHFSRPYRLMNFLLLLFGALFLHSVFTTKPEVFVRHFTRDDGLHEILISSSQESHRTASSAAAMESSQKASLSSSLVKCEKIDHVTLLILFLVSLGIGIIVTSTYYLGVISFPDYVFRLDKLYDRIKSKKLNARNQNA